MSISERYAKPLRKAVYGDDSYIVSSDPLAKDATHKIERLQKECSALRTALQSAYDDVYGCQVSGCNDAVDTMEVALNIRGEQGF